ncbi:hypothetical protein M2480_003188 [Parabacteroides sp. PFB2-12]|uniref:hypothetical protein n=1 Tax=unclassified Parabacteroides TaxID=2649774 RepID=UPI0024769858|nr:MULTISPECIES: hypothetical protein [unclassified Parabacteroides]MDH6344301.1 hypothetical protein [Parabacteroides sp. PM6-13]MDH6392180.1 hypothetical protein [Parabacteroides sp. PFB2-12]MDL2309595.1 hypothetical protein [Parabacteroides sp. OttesenSCG-928-B22]
MEVDCAYYNEASPCWVFIYREDEKAYRLQIGFSRGLPQMLAQSIGKTLLYYRQFPSTDDGLAHKLLLENLSSDSLHQRILRTNAQLNNLLQEFRLPDVNDLRQ